MNEFKIDEAGGYIQLEFAGGPARFHAIWLLDNALDETTRHPKNHQRLITILDLPPNSKITNAKWVGDNITIEFDHTTQKTYPIQFLWHNRYDKPINNNPFQTPENAILWDKTAQNIISTINYHDALHDEYKLFIWLQNLYQYGFAVMNGVPCESGQLIKVAEIFTFVRQTNYGQWFEVRADVNPTNLAYTNLGLQAHTDNPYRNPVPTMQILMALENNVAGGDSIVIDGFKIAEQLYKNNPKHYVLLSNYLAFFDYHGDAKTRLNARVPILEKNLAGQLVAVRFNNRSAAPFSDIPFDKMDAYYNAYRTFAQYIEDEQFMIKFKLEAGQLFIVDNTRVLHARTAFHGHGVRHLQGCYPDKDGFVSTYNYLREKYGNHPR